MKSIVSIVLALCSALAFAQPKPSMPGPRTVTGSFEVIGCVAERKTDCARPGSGIDGVFLHAGNGEIYLLHSPSEDARRAFRDFILDSAVRVNGHFAWQGRMRTLSVESLEGVTAEDLEAARSVRTEVRMTTYYMTFLRPGPEAEVSEERQRELMVGHFAHIAKHAASGALVIAGPFGEQLPTRELSGIYIYRADSLEAAEALAGEDPALQAGYFAAKTIPWYGPLSLGY